MSKKVEITNDTRIIRHKPVARVSHWFLVISFFMTMFTGVAFFFPDFAWLTEILGTPQLARAIHPFTGIVMFIAFIIMALIYWDHNIPEKNDLKWALNLAMFTLLITGIIMWRKYFSHNFSIQTLRIAILLHSASAFALFTGILVHMYMAFWIKGSIRGMVEGWVTVRWAKKHHPKWYNEEVKPELEKELAEEASKG